MDIVTLQSTQVKLNFWQYGYAMVLASKKSPCWRQEHESSWSSFRSIVICLALILSLLGLVVPLVGFTAGSVVFWVEISQAILQYNMTAIIDAIRSFGVFTAAVLAWIIWFKMALCWFEMQRLGITWPIVGTALALIPTIHYGYLAIFALPSMVLACFLCVWHTVGEKTQAT